MDDDLGDLIGLLRGRGETLASCESLTGGLVGGAITAVPGASDVYRGGLVTYASDLKERLASVPGKMIEEHGVVSAEVALAMARGARTACRTDWGIATTGVAGPDSCGDVPVGVVWIAAVGPDGQAARLLRLESDRDNIRRQAVCSVIGLLARLVDAS